MCDAAIKPGTTKCRWKDTKSWTGAMKEGIITQITAIHKNHLTVEVRELQNTTKRTYLKSTEIEIGTRNDEYQKLTVQLKRELSEKIETLEKITHGRDADQKLIKELRRKLSGKNRMLQSMTNGRDVYKKDSERHKSRVVILENEKKKLMDTITTQQLKVKSLKQQMNNAKNKYNILKQKNEKSNKMDSRATEKLKVKSLKQQINDVKNKYTDLQRTNT
eukprot:311755_1